MPEGTSVHPSPSPAVTPLYRGGALCVLIAVGAGGLAVGSLRRLRHFPVIPSGGAQHAGFVPWLLRLVTQPCRLSVRGVLQVSVGRNGRNVILV